MHVAFAFLQGLLERKKVKTFFRRLLSCHGYADMHIDIFEYYVMFKILLMHSAGLNHRRRGKCQEKKETFHILCFYFLSSILVSLKKSQRD